MKNLSLYARFLMLALACLMQSAAIAQGDAESLYKDGLAQLEAGKYKAAVKTLTKAVKQKTNYKQAYKARGDAYLGLEKWGDAMDDFNKAIELDAKYGEAYTGRGKAKFGMGDKDKGCEDYVKGRQMGDHKAFDLVKKDCE